jgi:hypothetical protein
MKASRALLVLTIGLLSLALAVPAAGRGRKSRRPPKPLNKGVEYEAYKGTDVAQIKYETSRKEFRVGHSPYLVVRFHVAEYALITAHVRKYLRPDYKAEIKMAPKRSKPALMANKTFQQRWRSLMKEHRKLLAKVRKLRLPAECKAAHAEFVAALTDELKLAAAVEKRMFVSQKIRARELLCQDLKERFRSRDSEWFDRLCEQFENDADLSKFYPRFVDMLIKPRLDKAQELLDRAMDKVGVEYAVAVEEEGPFGEEP